jgi:hypothetical protein
MWDSTELDRQAFGSDRQGVSFVESHISQKTSEIWGTRNFWLVESLSRHHLIFALTSLYPQRNQRDQ